MTALPWKTARLFTKLEIGLYFSNTPAALSHLAALRLENMTEAQAYAVTQNTTTNMLTFLFFYTG